LYGFDATIAHGHRAWYSIDGYSYGVNDWRGNAVAENQLHRRRPNDIPLDDVTPLTGNSADIAVATTSTKAAATTTAADLRFSVISLLFHQLISSLF